MLVHGLRLISHSLNEDVMLCYTKLKLSLISRFQEIHEWYPGTRIRYEYPGNGNSNKYRVPVPSTGSGCMYHYSGRR